MDHDDNGNGLPIDDGRLAGGKAVILGADGKVKSTDLMVRDSRASSMEPIRPAETSQVSSEAGMLLLQAMSQGLPTEQLQLFLEHHKAHTEREQRASYAAALAKAQGEYGTPRMVKQSDRGKYAPMDQDVAAIREANAKYGLAFSHRVESTVIPDSKPPSALVTVQCIVSHDGHEEAHPPMQTIAAEIPGQKGPQMSLIRATKSATTFLRRLTLEAAFGLAPEGDDDGMAHQGTKPSQNRAPKQQPPKQQPPKQQPPKQQSKPTSCNRATDCVAKFKGITVLQSDLEYKVGKPIEEWTDTEISLLIPIYQRLAKLPNGEERDRAIAKEFDLEPGALG
jgi:hypothetical protein